MSYIGRFGDLDPNRKARQLEEFGSALQFAMSVGERKKQERAREREADINRFMDMAQRFPGAAQTMGEGLIAKYGDEIPYLRDMVDAVKQRTEAQKGSREAGKRWVQGVEQREAALQPFTDPNSPAYQMPIGILPPLGPEIGAALAGQAQAKTRQLPGEAAQALPFGDRLAAQAWAKEQGYAFPPPPTQYDPLVHQTQAGKQRYAAYAGLDPTAGAREAADIAAQLEPSAGAVLSAEVRREEGRRAERRMEQEDERIALNKQRQALEAKKEERLSKSGSETSTKAKKSATTEVAKWLQSDTDLLAKEWDTGLKELANARSDGKVTPDVRREYAEGYEDSVLENGERRKVPVDGHGPRPEPMLKSQANLIASRIASELGDNADVATIQQYADAARAKYLRLIGNGLTRNEAVKHVLDGTEP